jgi:hypothetical protein
MIVMVMMGIAIFGLYPALQLWQWHEHEEMEESMKQYIPDDQLTVFQNPGLDKDVHWEHAGEEFHYKGAMYDVVRMKADNGNKVYYCLDDRRESQVYALLENVVHKQSAGHSTQKPIKLFIQVFTPCDKYTHLACCLRDIREDIHNYYSFYYPAHSLQIVAPPPEMV